MKHFEIPSWRMLAELLRLQRWAGGDCVSTARIFGLMHGFESTMEEENATGINRETQTKVEDLLEAVEQGKQPTDGPAVKDRLRQDKINEADAALVMKLCLMQSRFAEAIDQIINGTGSVFSDLRGGRAPEADWFGALHYMELVDCTEGTNKQLHAVFAPCVPRVGERVTPQNGSPMRVIGVEYLTVQQDDALHSAEVILVPYVSLESIDDSDD